MNASCEFDVATLRPTYRLLGGIPGKSNAFAISARLGLPEEVIAEARTHIKPESASFEETLEKLEQIRQSLERDRLEASKKLAEAERNRKESANLRIELSMRLDKAGEKARTDAERIIAEARETAEGGFAELDAMRDRQTAEEDHIRTNEARAELRRKLNEAEDKFGAKEQLPKEPKRPGRPAEVGDTVELLKMGIRAEVVSIGKDGVLGLVAGRMNLSMRQDEVCVIEGVQKRVFSASSGVSLRSASVAGELDLRGMETLDAIPALERYIDSAVMGKLKSATIIHGKGTGVLRQAVRQYLKSCKSVQSFRPGVTERAKPA
jgi:DNA mismatch repair protein MutS2